MSKIKSSNTKLETDFLALLSSKIYPLGYRYRKHYSKLIGKPDIVFVSKKVVIFIDGDVWHGYNYLKLGKKLPKKYWLKKIKRTIKRDKVYSLKLKALGWKVVRISEHNIKKNPLKQVIKVVKLLKLKNLN